MIYINGRFLINNPTGIENFAYGMCKAMLEKGIKFIINPSALPNNLMLDETRLRQILFNLAGNAIKFTEKGSVSLNTSFIFIANIIIHYYIIIS